MRIGIYFQGRIRATFTALKCVFLERNYAFLDFSSPIYTEDKTHTICPYMKCVFLTENRGTYVDQITIHFEAAGSQLFDETINEIFTDR